MKKMIAAKYNYTGTNLVYYIRNLKNFISDTQYCRFLRLLFSKQIPITFMENTTQFLGI